MVIAYVAPLSKDEYINAKADFMTIKNSQEIIEKIVARSLYIFDKIADLLNLKYNWVAFDTIDLEKYQGDSVGEYDYQRYFETFKFYSDIDELEYNKKFIDVYFNQFPSRFIYEDFDDEVLNTIELIKVSIDSKKERLQKKRKRDKDREKERNRIRPEVIASIKSKLTALELSFIEFK